MIPLEMMLLMVAILSGILTTAVRADIVADPVWLLFRNPNVLIIAIILVALVVVITMLLVQVHKKRKKKK